MGLRTLTSTNFQDIAEASVPKFVFLKNQGFVDYHTRDHGLCSLDAFLYEPENLFEIICIVWSRQMDLQNYAKLLMPSLPTVYPQETTTSRYWFVGGLEK